LSTVPATATSTNTNADDSKRWFSLVILSLSLAIIVIDASIVNVALPSIRKDFGASLRDLEWVSAAYSLIFAALIITWGRLGDMIGRRTIFIAGVTTFGVGSIIVGLANPIGGISGIGVIVFGRVIQGLGAAMASPSTLSILTSTFTGKSRGVAFGIWGATAGAGGALGPLIGGLLITNASWRWAFLVNIPIVIIAIVGSFLYITESTDKKHKNSIDIFGIIFITLGIGAAVFGLIEGQTYGWLQPKETFAIGSFNWPFTNIAFAPVMFIFAVFFITAFVFYENYLLKRGDEPLFNFNLLQYPAFRFGLITVSIVALGEFGILFVLSLYFQGVRGLSALDTGLILLPFAVGSFFTAPIAGILSSRFGAKWVVTAGMLLESIAIFLLSVVITTDTNRALFIPIFLLYGIGLGLAIAQLTSVVLSDIPPEYAGAGSGANNTLRQVGAAIGVAILGAVLASQLSTTAAADLAKNTIIPNAAKSGIQSTFDNGSSTGSAPATTGGPSNIPVQVQQAIGAQVKTIYNDASTEGTRSAARLASLFVFLGAVSSLFIPRPKRETADREQARVE